MRVLALVDHDALTRRVLLAAQAIARVLDLPACAAHAGTVDEHITGAADAIAIPVTFIGGDPMTALRAVVAEPDVAVMVLGARQRRGTGSPAGHVAEALLTEVSKPAVVVGPQCAALRPLRLERVLLPLDGSDASADAVRDVVDMFGRRGLDIIALHVFTEETVPPFFDQPQHAYPEFAGRFFARHSLHPSARLSLGNGEAARAVLTAISAEAADLVAVAWAQHLQPGRARIIRRLLTDSPVPVLLLPKPPGRPVVTNSPGTVRQSAHR